MNAEWPTARLQMEDQSRPPGYRNRSVTDDQHMNSAVDSNPYTPPDVRTDTSESSRSFDHRFLFLVLPPLIPFVVHSFVRAFIPADETLYLALFTLGAIIPAWIWSHTMIDRLRLAFWKSYLLATIVWGAVLASALISPSLVEWAVG
jgi:hypothetical protein